MLSTKFNTPSNAWRGRKWRLVLAAAAVTPMVLAGCSSPTSVGSADGGGTGGTLSVAVPANPQTLDPATTSTDNAMLLSLAYEPLIVQRTDGSLAPGLASRWSYQGAGNTTLVLHLRPGVKFADGSDLTANDVVADLQYVTKGVLGTFFADATFTATDPLTVTIHMAKPNPDLPQFLTQWWDAGDMISPKGLASPAALGTQTFGAGPYKLDPLQTVAGDYYTFVPNRNFYDQSQVHWQKVIVKVISNAQSTLSALEAGQVDVALGDPSTAGSAHGAGLTVTSAPLLWTGVVLADRKGTIAKPLADARVRQALNYATDRSSIVDALYKGTGTETTQPTVSGGYGYDPTLDSAYPYDVAKAKQLLAEAGYPNGFTLSIATPETQSQNLVAEALVQQWKQIGVNLQVKDYANANQFAAVRQGAKAPSFMTTFGQLPMWLTGKALFLPTATWNPFHTADPTLQALYGQEASSSSAQQAQLDKQITDYLVNQAWFVPVAASDISFYSSKAVSVTPTTAAAPHLSLVDVRPAS